MSPQMRSENGKRLLSNYEVDVMKYCSIKPLPPTSLHPLFPDQLPAFKSFELSSEVFPDGESHTGRFLNPISTSLTGLVLRGNLSLQDIADIAAAFSECLFQDPPHPCEFTAGHLIKKGNGTIAIEEAWTIPELLPLIARTPPLGEAVDVFIASFTDVHGRRLDLMNENNIDFMVLSCATPCVQGVSDPVAAAALAVNVNDQMAAAISNDTTRFGGFASLSMHNATEAAQELRRAVKELGFLGAMLNDYQQSGPDNTTLLYYDQPEYDEFWQAVTELDVPIYFHPRSNIDQIQTLLFDHAPFLKGPSEEYAVTLANHILGHKIFIYHDFLTSFYVETSELARNRPNGLMMQRNVTSYWHTNIYETTSGNFATPLLEFHIDQIGIDRILYSVDYPFVLIPEGEAWVESLKDVLNEKDLRSLKRGLAMELLHLDD
ncbi:hypothetical protein C0995_003588 [Termitomyces sp. Mi166|nr:hypothetical protein C0995_003588 [Termitomyces sp. Mi166\